MPTVTKELIFPKIEPSWLASRDALRFLTIVDGKVTPCLIGGDTFLLKFDAGERTAEEALKAFRNHQAIIEEAVRRKFERGDIRSGSEVTLSSSDFPMLTTSHPRAPLRFRDLETSESEAIQKDPELMGMIGKVNHYLNETLIRGRRPVLADWKLIGTSGKDCLIHLTLTEKDTGVSVDRWFTRTDLSSLSGKDFPLFRAWDELQGEIIRAQLNTLVSAAESEE